MKVLGLIIVAFGLTVCNGQSQDDIFCVTNWLGLDAQACLTQFDTATDGPEERASFCGNGCAQSVADAYANCNFAEVAQAILTICTVDSQGRFCQEVLNNNETIDNLTNICVADFDCAAGSEGPCSVAFQEIGCCASGGFDAVFSNCNLSVCDPPFVLGTGTPPPPNTDNPGFALLFCLSNNILQNQDLQEQCSKYIPDIMDFDPDATEPPTDMSSFFFGDDPVEFCTSICSERIAEALNECESMFGSVASVFPDAGIENITFAEFIQKGCAKDNMNRFCFDDDSYLPEVEQITAANGPCEESLANGECDATCKDAFNSVSCCVSTISQMSNIDNPETRLLASCDLQPCAVPFALDGSTTATTEKASTVHGAVAVVMLISAIVSALMI